MSDEVNSALPSSRMNEANSTARLKKRADFVRTSRGTRCSERAFTLQQSDPRQESLVEPRLGFTVTKKVGNAAVRNRVKRRLREASRFVKQNTFRANHDYVLIGREATLKIDFQQLCTDIETAAGKLADGRGKRGYTHKRRAKK